MKLVIDRNKWLRGEGEAFSRLLRSRDEKMCCLGFYAKELGYKDDDIRNAPAPAVLKDFSKSWPSWAYKITSATFKAVSSTDLSELMEINDNENIDAAEREEKIKEIFASHDIEVEFVGE